MVAGLMLAALPAVADTDHAECSVSSCVHVHCANNGVCTRTPDTETHDPAGYYPGVKPMRYACDAHGQNCHNTRSYFYNLQGRPVYDPSGF
jgi:hypothetical protein